MVKCWAYDSQEHMLYLCRYKIKYRKKLQLFSSFWIFNFFPFNTMIVLRGQFKLAPIPHLITRKKNFYNLFFFLSSVSLPSFSREIMESDLLPIFFSEFFSDFSKLLFGLSFMGFT